ncbi:MAG: hypothetical protein GY847_41965 [Proteobacteria bacterium]|nr:hypothetical protein [Pseudomonadota bacterium]
MPRITFSISDAQQTAMDVCRQRMAATWGQVSRSSLIRRALISWISEQERIRKKELLDSIRQDAGDLSALANELETAGH